MILLYTNMRLRAGPYRQLFLTRPPARHDETTIIRFFRFRRTIRRRHFVYVCITVFSSFCIVRYLKKSKELKILISVLIVNSTRRCAQNIIIIVLFFCFTVSYTISVVVNVLKKIILAIGFFTDRCPSRGVA